MAARVQWNRKVRSQLIRQPGMQKMLREATDAVKDAAERETPIGDTGDAIHGYKTVMFPTRGRVINTDFFFHLIEWGSVNNPAYAPMRRGVRRAGLRLEIDAKRDDAGAPAVEQLALF